MLTGKTNIVKFLKVRGTHAENKCYGREKYSLGNEG